MVALCTETQKDRHNHSFVGLHLKDYQNDDINLTFYSVTWTTQAIAICGDRFRKISFSASDHGDCDIVPHGI
jgi:hypothetical protein